MTYPFSVYRILHNRMKRATAEAAIWKRLAEDRRLVIETYFDSKSDRIALWKRITHQRAELRRLIRREGMLTNQVRDLKNENASLRRELEVKIRNG